MLCYLEWWNSKVRIRYVTILLTLWSEIFSSFVNSLGLKKYTHTHTYTFFFRVCPLFFEIERFMGQVTLFLAFIEFCLGLSVLPSTLAIKAFLFKDSFHFCLLPPSPFLFYFLFLSNFFVFSCDGHPAYTRFTYMGSSFASYSSSTESRSTAWSRDTSFCGYTHSPLRPGYRSG